MNIHLLVGSGGRSGLYCVALAMKAQPPCMRRVTGEFAAADGVEGQGRAGRRQGGDEIQHEGG